MKNPVYKDILTKNVVKYTNNSRKHSEQQVQQIVKSIKEFGFTNPVLIDENNRLIAGHCRLEAAILLNLETIPCIVLSHLTDAQKKAYVIADNKLTLNADWDFIMLQKEFESLRLDDFDLELTGFSLEEIESLMPEEEPEVFCDENDCPDAPEEPIAKPGDIWLLGEHRLMCGDSTVQTDVDRLLNGQSPNLMVTDPPYGVNYEADWRARANKVKKTEREVNSSLINDNCADWYDAYVLFPGNVAYVWHAYLYSDVVMYGLRQAGFEIKQIIIWNKNVHALSRSEYHWKHEPCLYAIKKGAERNWKGGRNQTTVWDVHSIIYEKDKTSHPTQKPVELYERSINNHTNVSEYVYDPFAGSGTLAIASEKTKRRALMMELDPKYVDVIIKRWENFTGKKAILEDNHAACTN